jgi:hypothetical protein
MVAVIFGMKLLPRHHRELEIDVVLLRPLPGEVRARLVDGLEELVTPVDELGALGAGGAGNDSAAAVMAVAEADVRNW